PAVVTGTWQGFWIYLVGPALGAAVGVGLARVLGRGERRVDQARISRLELRSGMGDSPRRSHKLTGEA
ncbi:MAG TPA: hypothetical protein VGK17_19865, partial [Propionicimonas sp.]